MDLTVLGKAAKAASFQLATASTAQKNQALASMADQLEAQSASILAANAKDIALGREAGLSDAMLDRLLLNESRLQAIANDVRNVIKLNDPVGSEIDSRVLETACHWHAVASPLVWSASFMKLALTSPLILRRCV